MNNAISLYEAKTLIREWADLFDAHAAPEMIIRITAGEDFAIRFGDITYQGLAGLKEHDTVKAEFFDEHHLYYNYRVVETGPPLVLETSMVWDTHRELPNGQGIEHLIADLEHRWTFIRRASDGQPAFLEHRVLAFNYRPGYSPTPDSKQLHTDPSRVGGIQ